MPRLCSGSGPQEKLGSDQSSLRKHSRKENPKCLKFFIYCGLSPCLGFFYYHLHFCGKVHFSSKVEVGGRDVSSVLIYCLSIVTASICLNVVGGSFFCPVNVSNNDLYSRFVHFLPENIWVKNRFSNQLFFLLLHLDVCDSLTFIQASLYTQDSTDLHFPIFSVSSNTFFYCLTHLGQIPMFIQLKPFSKSAQCYHFVSRDTEISISVCSYFVLIEIILRRFRLVPSRDCIAVAIA